MRGFLAGDPGLFSNEVVHGHLTAERSGGRNDWAATDGAFSVIVEENNGAVREVQGRERAGRVCHVGEADDVGGGFS